MRSLSAHLFWDCVSDAIEPERHASWLTKRVLEYGRWGDWQILVEEYGKERLAEIVGGLRSLDPKAAAFCCAYFDLPSTFLRCSITSRFPKPSTSC